MASDRENQIGSILYVVGVVFAILCAPFAALMSLFWRAPEVEEDLADLVCVLS